MAPSMTPKRSAPRTRLNAAEVKREASVNTGPVEKFPDKSSDDVSGSTDSAHFVHPDQCATKRPAADLQPQVDRQAKRHRYFYGRVITVKVWSTELISASPTSTPESFFVHEELLFENSTFIKSEIARQNLNGTYHIYDCTPEHFKCYLDWIHDKTMDSNIEKHQHAEHSNVITQDGDDGVVCTRLCELLVMNEVSLKDEKFKCSIVNAIIQMNDRYSATINMDLSHLLILWNVALHAKFEDMMVDWSFPGITWEQLEATSSTIDADLLIILRDRVISSTLMIYVVPETEEETYFVSLSVVNRRSRNIADLLAGKTPPMVTAGNPGLISFSPNTIQVTEDPGPGVLRNWVSTLTRDGEELETVMQLYPSIKDNLEQAQGFKSALCKMWILAERLGDQKLQRLIMASLLKHGDRTLCRGRSITHATQAMIAAKVPPTGGLRLWLVDVLAVTVFKFDDSSVIQHYPPSLLLEILLKVHKISGVNSCRRPGIGDIAKYCEPA